MNRTYMVVYERIAEDNWGGWTPDVGGAVGAGDSLQQARQSLREGIAIMLEDLAERGMGAPAVTSMSVDFSQFDSKPEDSHYEIEWMTVDLPEVHSRTTDREQIAA